MENSFKGIILSLTFDMAGDTCRRCKEVVYGNYWLPVGNHVMSFWPKLP